MEGLSYENVRCKNPVLHFILSWRAEESPTNEQVDEAVNIALGELDLQDCQALWALQSDTENLHVHVAVNRVSPKTYRAIHPAGGWTKKALERAARKIEIVQGWEVERTGRYEVDESGNIFERASNARKLPEVSQKARDVEAHTGIESLERQAKREVSKILETATSWDELHEKLAIRVYELERKGNGAVLKYEDKAVKVSNVSRRSSFSRLERRLGKYQERRKDVSVQQGKSSQQASKDATSEIEIRKKSWEEYRAERTYYLRGKISTKRIKRASKGGTRKPLFSAKASPNGSI